MAERFLKLNTEKIEDHEGDWLAKNHPYAFALLYFIARRARRTSGSIDGLGIGMAKLGDWNSLGLTRQNYRTALKVLTTEKFIEICETNRTRKKSTTGSTTEGTLVRILDTRIWDINSDQANHRSNHCPTTDQPLTNHCPNHEQERKKEREEREEREEEKQTYAQTAPRLRTKDSLSYDFSNYSFTGMTVEDVEGWKLMYPYIDIEREALKAAEWIKANPSKGNKKNWRTYITGWFRRANDSAENKKAYKSAGNIPSGDRSTKDVHGIAVKAPGGW